MAMTDVDPDLKIPGYRIIRELGRGGMAKVYLAMQESMEREVALKIMLPSLSAADPSFSDRFLREARIVAKLSHPNIIAVIDVGVSGPYHYYSMEYHTGGDLKSRIHNGMMPKMALGIVRQVANALAFAHSKGYVHRDVKPENVIFRQDGTALLTDFGIAKAAEATTRMTATGAVIGTPHYMSPEQAQGTETDGRSDLYSLGIMFFEMLTGNVPYTGTSALSIGIKHLKEPVPQLPPPVHVYQPLLEKFLAKDPNDRFQSGDEAITAIDVMSSGSHPTLSGAATVIANSGSQPTVVATQVSGQMAKTRITGQTEKTQITGTASAKSGSRTILITAAVLLPLLGAAGYFMLRGSPAPTTTPPSPSTASNITPADNTANRVAALLAEADVAALAGRYLEPRDQSAVTKYRQVLELDAANTRATRGLQEIAGHYIAQIDRALEKKNLDEAATALKNAEAADSNNPLLAARRQALSEARNRAAPAVAATKPAPAPKSAKDTARKPEPTPAPVVATAPARVNEAQEREQKLNGIITRIQELLSPGNLTVTRAGLATELLADATKLAPDDVRLRNTPSQIADAYLKLATERADAKDFPEADRLVRKGLDLAPNHRALAGLQKDIAERQKTKPRTFGTF